MKRKIPTFKTDEEAAHFVDRADLTEYDLSGLRPVQFEFQAKSAQLIINMRVPDSLLKAVKERARTRGIPFTRYIRLLMEADLSKPHEP
jgi:predicted DNA binding CopG/RHH family protein